jgi:predicted dehydrogenase
VSLFGPVESVLADGSRTWPARTIGSGPLTGQSVPVAVDTHVTVLLRFVSGAVATLLTTFDVTASELPRFEVFGEEGTLSLPDPNVFAAPVRVRTEPKGTWREVPQVPGFGGNARGIGALELRLATAAGRPPRASGELASHVLDVLEGALTAIRSGQRVAIDSRPLRPTALSNEELQALGWTREVPA